MGYTRYWKRTDKKITTDFILEVCEVIADCDRKGIAIRNGYGEGNPVVTLDKVWLNGDEKAAHDLSHETLYIGNEPDDFEFCKTARKPYDYAVREILRIAQDMGLVTGVRSDGENDRIISDEEYLKIYFTDSHD